MTSPQQTKIKQFCFSQPKETNNYSQVFVAQPEKNFLEKFGHLCILINLNFQDEIKNKTLTWASDWSQELIDLIKNDFYNPLRQGEELEKEFEDSLQKINHWIQKEKSNHQNIFENELLNFDIDIVVVKENNVYFSQIGGIETYLLKKGKLINLIEEKNNSTKFLNIVSGPLEPSGLLFFANKELFDYFSQQKITQIFEQTSLKNITKEIKKLLNEEIKNNNFFSLIISLREEPEEKDEPKVKPVPERITEKDEPKAKPVPEEKEKISPDSKSKKSTIKKEKKEKISSKGPKIKKKTIDLPITKTTRLSYFRKYLLFFIIILALLFAQSIFLLARKQINIKKAQEYAATLEKLEIAQEELSIAFTYQDPKLIKTSINKFKNILNQLPQETEEQKQTYNLFTQEYIEQLNQFYNLKNILNPLLVVDLSQKYSEIITGGLVNLNNNLYIFNPENNYIYLFDLTTKEIELVNQTSANIGHLKTLTLMDNDNLIGLDQNQGFVSFNILDKKIAPLNLNRQNDPQNIQDFYIYNRRLYTLEPLTNQVYKHDKTIDGFGREQNWITDETNLSQALSLAIDGSIYILDKKGQVLEFYQGELTDFSLADYQPVISTQDPNITKALGKIKLYTSSELKHLYLLDGPSQRLIIFDKKGNLINQFTSPEFKDLKDFVINKQENKAWLLAGTKIFELEIK